MGPDTVDLAPGARGSIPFRISNPGGAALRVAVTIEAPAGWRVVEPTIEVDLAPTAELLRVVSLFPLRAAPAGTYPVALGAGGGAAGFAADTVFLRIAAEPRLRVDLEESPRWMTAGDRYRVAFRVVNTGNVALPVGLLLDGPDLFTVEADTATRRLDPGSSRDVVVDVGSPASVKRAGTYAVTLRAAAPGDSAEAVSRVEVVPMGREAPPERGGLPGQLRLRLGDDPRTGPAVRFHAAGPVRPGSGILVDALLQGPGREYSITGETDLYRLRVDARPFSLYLGDQVYSLSALTEPGREGFGVEARARSGPVELGGYGHRNRRSSDGQEQLGAFAGVHLGSYADLRGNWLRGGGLDSGREVWSAQATVRLPPFLVVRGEYGHRPANAADSRTVELSANAGPLSLAFRHLRGDSDYGGGYAGVSTDGGHFSFRPWGSLYLEGSVDAQSVARGSSVFPVDRSLRTGRLAVGWGSQVAVEARQVSERSGVAGGDRRRDARSLGVRLRLPLRALTLHPALEIGRVESSTTAAEPFWRGALRSELRWGPASLSQTLEYFTGGALHRSFAEDGFAGAFSGSLRLGANTRTQLSVQGTRYAAPVEREALMIDALIEHRLPFGHLLSARVLTRSYRGPFDHRETTLSLDYTIPFRLPVGLAPEGTSVVGRLYDMATGLPLPDRILEIGGRRVVTDEDGRAVIDGLPIGIHYIELDRGTAGLGQVPTVQLPLRIEVREGITTEFALGLGPAAALHVLSRIARASSVRGLEPSAPEALPHVLLDLTREGDHIRRATDEQGRLDLDGLRPGRWQVAVAHAELPPFHRFTADTVSVDIAPSGRAELELMAVPIPRPLEMVAMGEVSDRGVEAPRPPAAAVSARPSGTVAGPTVARRERPRPLPTGDGLPEGWTTFRTTASSSTLMEVARQAYFETGLWPKIWLANRSRIQDPDAVPVGSVLRIPPRGRLSADERRAHREYYAGP